MPKGVPIRGMVEHLGGTKVKFTCPHGHQEVRDYSKGPKPKRLTEPAIKLMMKWWSKGVTFECKKCRAELTDDKRR